MKKFLTLLLWFGLVTSHGQDFVPFLWDNSTGNGLLNGLLAFWRFEETSGNAADSSGNGRTLTEHGSPSGGGASGIVANDRGYSSTDHSDYFDRATESAFAFAGGAFTITAWASFNARSLDPNDMTVISRGDYTGSDFSWWLFLDHGSPDDTMYFVYSTDGTFNLANSVTFPISGEIGTGFNFIAVRWNGTTFHISVTHNSDTNLAADQTAAFSGTLYAGTPTLRVGMVEGDNLHDMGGEIDEVGIWNTYLSDCELAWLFSAKDGVFTYPSFDSFSCLAP